jgi:glycosidase
MLKKQTALLLIAGALMLGGCFGKNSNSSGDIGKGVKVIREGERAKIISEEEIAGGTFVIEGEISSEDILIEADKMKIVKIKDGKTYISIIDVDSPSLEGDNLFEIKNCKEKIKIEVEESINEGNFEKKLKKALKSAEKKGVRASTTDVLLGDFTSDNQVDINDFVLFKTNYGTTLSKYDIAPATVGSGAYADIYSRSTPDGNVGLLDFLIFGKNYGKGINVATVTGVTLTGVGTVEEGSTIDIYAKVSYSDNTTKSEVVEWSTSDETVATQTANGEWTRVNGLKSGTVTIKASKNGKVGELTVTVTPKGTSRVESVEVTGGNGVSIGGTLQLTATSLLSDGKSEISGATWTSGTPSVATVDSTGKVTGVASGTTKIKAVRGGVSHEITVVVAGAVNGVKVNAKGYKTIYAWEGTNTVLAGAWPGTALTAGASTGWGSYYFEGKDGINIILIDGSGNKTGDLTGIKKGEHWYADGKWYTYNPEQDFTAPEISATPGAGNQEPSSLDVVLTAKDNVDTAPKIYYTLDGTMPTISSTQFSGKVTLTKDTVIKAITVDSSSNISKVYVLSYKLNQDATPPVVTATPAPGRYETAQSVNLKITDNRDSGLNIYYTIDGTEPKAELSYLYNGQIINIDKTTTIKTYAKDKAGNENRNNFTYMFGKVSTTRFDPRQESIYFLLTTRWFDGDLSNTVGDDWCSYTEARATPGGPNYMADSGFTGPEDVTWRGDFKGLIDKMDYIKALGFTTIWITPIVQNRSPLAYHGYHGWDFTKEDARLVSPGYDFQRVIDEAHARDMKICLDIVINHSGRYGIKDFAEVQYARDSKLYPVPEGWESFAWDENRYNAGLSQKFPNNWEYDGLKSPGMSNGKALPPYATFAKDVRPFTEANIAKFPNLMTDKTAAGFLKFQWPSTQSYSVTIDGRKAGETNSLTYEQYKASERRLRGHNTGFPTGSGSFDNFPDAHLDSLHEDCPDLNTENPDVQKYMLDAYSRYIDMGVDMFRVDTVMHIHKETLNEMYWPQLLARAEQAKGARGGADFFIFGEVANFVNNLDDKPAQLQQSNYTWDASVTGKGNSQNHLLDGNNYRTADYSKKAPKASSPYHVSVIDIIAHNGFVDGVGGAYGRALGNDSAYNDATFLSWYTDSHDYGPNKGETRWKGDFASAWSMLFTFRGIPIVYYGSEIRFAAGKPNDWPGGGGGGVNMSLEKTGRSYFGPHLEGTVTATDFGKYTATGEVEKTLSHELAQHLMGLNKIRLAVPALQMGQYSTQGHKGGWAGYKRRYTGKNKITGENIDSYALVGVGAGTHSWIGVLEGEYVNILTGATVNASGGNISASASGSGDAALLVLVKKGLTTPAPGKISQSSPFLK